MEKLLRKMSISIVTLGIFSIVFFLMGPVSTRAETDPAQTDSIQTDNDPTTDSSGDWVSYPYDRSSTS